LLDIGREAGLCCVPVLRLLAFAPAVDVLRKRTTANPAKTSQRKAMESVCENASNNENT
jgi:hypothetical protein